jgi:hypothetical protein
MHEVIKIIIGNDYKIEADPMNVIVSKRTKSKDGSKENWTVIGYCHDYKQAIKLMCDNGLKCVPQDFFTLQAKLDEFYCWIDGLKFEDEPKRKPVDTVVSIDEDKVLGVPLFE